MRSAEPFTWTIIGQIVEGNWVVKRAAGTTPAILGNKLKQHHFRRDNYLETDIEIGTEGKSWWLPWLILGTDSVSHQGALRAVFCLCIFPVMYRVLGVAAFW